jgi:predicted transcriptional regulator YdeE
MEPRIVAFPQRRFAGMIYYGALSGEGWSAENPIGQLWERFSAFSDAHGAALAGHIVNPSVGYELNIWNEAESQATGRFYTFVGVEVDGIDFEVPPQIVIKPVPTMHFAHVVARGDEIRTWEKMLYEEWLPASGYQLPERFGYSFHIQAYEEGRFLGVGDLLARSEVDIYVPVEDKR